jgi:hypothetical protein
MHISTHHDRIWSSGCQRKEDDIAVNLAFHGINNTLVDAVKENLHQLPQPFASDNHFRMPVEYINLAPEFWHIYRCRSLVFNHKINYKYCCLMNRISGERLLLLYKLAKLNLLDKGLISFNCLYHDRDPSIEQRKQNFDTVHEQCNWQGSNEIYKTLRALMPMTLDVDPDTASLRSEKTVVVESYNSDTVIAFSEKIFRALQTPRPWLLCSSPDSVKILKQYGFDVLDDIVDHSYDSIEDQSERMDAMLIELQRPLKINVNRCYNAVENNQRLLDKFKTQWDQKLSNVLQSMGSASQSRLNTKASS